MKTVLHQIFTGILEMVTCHFWGKKLYSVSVDLLILKTIPT